MKILIAPLNWGLGHATRCVPLIRHYLELGDEVVLAGDGDSFMLLKSTFPKLRIIDLPPLHLRYTTNAQQWGFYIRAIWTLVRFTIADHHYLRLILAREHFDLIISDNRFGLFSKDTRSVYITHQLYPILPKRLRLFQPLARVLHACIYKRYHEVWVPDYVDLSHNLSGALSHGGRFDKRAKYIGPLSRFALAFSEEIPEGCRRDTISCTCSTTSTRKTRDVSGCSYATLVILSGLEPQRTILEREILQRFVQSPEPVLLVRGKLSEPHTAIKKGNITILPFITDDEFIAAAQKVHTIIARSGYSTIMDLEVLGVLDKAEFYPTPGQSEQEYLLQWMSLCR